MHLEIIRTALLQTPLEREIGKHLTDAKGYTIGVEIEAWSVDDGKWATHLSLSLLGAPLASGRRTPKYIGNYPATKAGVLTIVEIVKAMEGAYTHGITDEWHSSRSQVSSIFDVMLDERIAARERVTSLEPANLN